MSYWAKWFFILCCYASSQHIDFDDPHVTPNIIVLNNFLAKFEKLQNVRLIHEKERKPMFIMALNSTVRASILFQIEHSIFRPTGMNIPDVNMPSKVFFMENGEPYLFGVNQPAAMEKADIIVEYASMNVAHYLGQLGEACAANIVYLPPLPFVYNTTKRSNATKEVITSFRFPGNGDRRGEVREKIRSDGIKARNVYFQNLEAMLEKLDGTQILVNVHQTSYAQTLEEFRILPALQRGVIVVSEEIPKPELFLFHEFVIFGKYEELPKIVAEVADNYDKYYDILFGDGRLHHLVEKTLESSYGKFESLLKSALQRSAVHKPAPIGTVFSMCFTPTIYEVQPTGNVCFWDKWERFTERRVAKDIEYVYDLDERMVLAQNITVLNRQDEKHVSLGNVC